MTKPELLQTLILAATAVYAFYAFQLWRITDRTLRASQRAWLVIDVIRKDDDWSVDHKTHFVISYQNTGNGPARNVKVVTACFPFAKDGGFPPEDQVPYAPEIWPAARFVVGPHQTKWTPLECGPITPDGWKLLGAGAPVMHIVGRLDYVDVFDEPHRTIFCALEPKFPGDKSSYMACPYYNAAD